MPTPADPGPPVARRAPTVAVVHGERREDGYAWLRAKDDPEVRAAPQAENAYTDRAMAPTAAFQGALYQEMLARIKEDDATVPVPFGGFSYYSRTEQGKQDPIYCPPAGGPGVRALGASRVTDDGRRLAYATDVTGFREYTLHVKDLATGELAPERIERVAAVAGAAGPAGLF